MNPHIAEPTHAFQSEPTDLSVDGLLGAGDQTGMNPLLEPSAPTSIGHNDCSIDIYDPWDVDRALAEIVSLPSVPGKISAADHPAIADRLEELGPEQRARAREFLKMIAQGPTRRGILGNNDMIACVEALKESSPQFTSYIDLVLGQLAVSKLTATSLRIPPTVLLGPPGVGKTHFARRLASILGTSTKSVTASSSHDLRGNFLGLNPFWRNARMGYIARAMINGDTASPVFIIDEADKARDDGQINGLDFLHEILEPESAAHLNDEYLEVPLMTRNCVWLFLANDISAFSESILDRVVVVDVPASSEQQQRAIVQSIAHEVAHNLNLPSNLTIPDMVLTRLVESPARKARQILERCFANAARRGTLSINQDDLARACAMVSARETINKKSFGFRPAIDHAR